MGSGALLRCYAALSCSSVPTFRDNLSVTSLKVLCFLTLEDEPDKLSRNVGTELRLTVEVISQKSADLIFITAEA
jgi:hypothetical protein